MKKFIKYPSIEQFRNIIKQVQMSAQYIGKDSDNNPVYDKSAEMPIITFKGTVKLHGTNASICYNNEAGLWVQSRNNIITVENDNAGFAFFVKSKEDSFFDMIHDIAAQLDISLNENTITVYGEWCGGNIQKGVSISGLPKMFVIFGFKVTPFSEDECAYWINPDRVIIDEGIYCIEDFPTYEILIDFNDPQLAQNKLVELTEAVEAECPVGKHFGNSGVGEGIVWEAEWNTNRYRFKVKGEKHSSSKVKTLAEVDVEKLNSINEFVEYAVTENRLNQGIEQVFTSQNIEPDRKLTGAFVKWVSSDVFKEEMDTLIENGLEPKDVGGKVSKTASQWFMKYLDKEIGL